MLHIAPDGIYGQIADSKPANLSYAKRVKAELEKHYAGHPWLVSADIDAGTVTVQLLYTSRLGRTGQWGFMMHLEKLVSPEGLRKVMRAGGELLERYRLARGKAVGDSAEQARSNGIIGHGGML